MRIWSNPANAQRWARLVGGVQFSATELVEAIAFLRELDAEQRPPDLAQMWEVGCEDLAEVLDQIYALIASRKASLAPFTRGMKR